MGVMRGLGYAITPMLVAVSGACLYRIIWLATIFTWFPTQQVLYLCYATSWIPDHIDPHNYISLRKENIIRCSQAKTNDVP